MKIIIFDIKVVRQQRAYLEKVKCEHLKNWTCLKNPASLIPKSVLIECTICRLGVWNQFIWPWQQQTYTYSTTNLKLNQRFSRIWFSFLERVNVASSTDLGILLSDILDMVVTKSEPGGETFNEQFCMCFV